MENEVLACIRARRSVRKFTEDRQVDEAHLAALLEAATWAPSGSNSQTWLFTVIQNGDALLRLNEAVRQGFLNWTPDDDYPAKKHAKILAEKEGYNFYYRAPTLILASNVAGYQNGAVDCAAGLENIFLAATSLGLGTCWINQVRWLSDDPGVRAVLTDLGVPENHVFYGGAAVGYTTETPTPPKRKEGTTLIIR